MTGMTAWVGFILVEVNARGVVFIREPPVRSEVWPGSWRNCAGAVPSGQPVRRKRCSFLMEECGFDIAFNYRVGPLVEQLNLEGPDGIDVYFGNLGGSARSGVLAPPQ